LIAATKSSSVRTCWSRGHDQPQVAKDGLDAEALADEPEVAGIVFSLGPKLLLNIDDVPATNLLQPGNRATWRLLVADRAAARSSRTGPGSAPR
jgi:hypothetical protein